MTPATSAYLILAVAALASCCAAWYERASPGEFDEPNQVNRGRIRSSIALSALLCATSSATIYVVLLLAWVISSHSLVSRSPVATAAIWVGLLSSGYAIVGGLFAYGIQRLLIVASSMATALLWLLDAAASAAV
jgi:hypothetical protein